MKTSEYEQSVSSKYESCTSTGMQTAIIGKGGVLKHREEKWLYKQRLPWRTQLDRRDAYFVFLSLEDVRFFIFVFVRSNGEDTIIIYKELDF